MDDHAETRLDGRIDRIDGKLDALRAQLEDELKPLRRIADLAIAAWALLVLIVGTAVALLKDRFGGAKH